MKNLPDKGCFTFKVNKNPELHTYSLEFDIGRSGRKENSAEHKGNSLPRVPAERQDYAFRISSYGKNYGGGCMNSFPLRITCVV